MCKASVDANRSRGRCIGGGNNEREGGDVREMAINVNQCSVFFFFFQAEDGIRDLTVTGVQTCALPICSRCEGIRVRDRASGGGARCTSSRPCAARPPRCCDGGAPDATTPRAARVRGSNPTGPCRARPGDRTPGRTRRAAERCAGRCSPWPPRQPARHRRAVAVVRLAELATQRRLLVQQDRKSTRLNSSHSQISYAVFCLKKKTTK